ncbi:MAG: PAS domain S-box protein [Paraburkholderia sp.]|uniref:PAS domain S-box protein n=1 Tax=Paraburkholderia sp. TaxID=1926495 RepID=UPI0011FE8CF7|nr:PAS domain S-box protein [Paraburkholderia sp.]TAM00352.1 MAG: PAS domain S-box protein [Paraburkholderia sp.]
MKGNAAFRDFDDLLGTTSPVWKFANDSCVLQLSASGQEIGPRIAVDLSARQAERIRSLTGVTDVLILDVTIHGKRSKLHLVGKKINTYEWAGVAALLMDSESVAENSMQALAFAEGIVSEVNAIVVVLDRAGRIHRFNKKAEEYTNRKEEHVIGENAQALFMAPDEGRRSKENISRFFEEGSPRDVKRVIQTVSGARSFIFRNRFLRPIHEDRPELIVCSGVEVKLPDSANEADQSEEPNGALTESHAADVMRKIMDWGALVNGARALLTASDGIPEPDALEDAKRLAAWAVRDAHRLYDEIDARLVSARGRK